MATSVTVNTAWVNEALLKVMLDKAELPKSSNFTKLNKESDFGIYNRPASGLNLLSGTV